LCPCSIARSRIRPCHGWDACSNPAEGAIISNYLIF